MLISPLEEDLHRVQKSDNTHSNNNKNNNGENSNSVKQEQDPQSTSQRDDSSYDDSSSTLENASGGPTRAATDFTSSHQPSPRCSPGPLLAASEPLEEEEEEAADKKPIVSPTGTTTKGRRRQTDEKSSNGLSHNPVRLKLLTQEGQSTSSDHQEAPDCPRSTKITSRTSSRLRSSPSTLPPLSTTVPAVHFVKHQKSRLTDALFVEKPPWCPSQPPVTILDHWHHGQFIWWNRFLANRKKSRGYAIGYHVGRIVDLESEWFPTVDLVDTKKRLRLQASQLGRRSVFVQSMDDLRYMAIPPRAITVFPDPDAVTHRIIWEGCKSNSTSSYRGLLRAKMIQELREALDAENTLLEIEVLNLLFHSQEEDPTSSESEIQYLEHTTVWDVLESRRVKPCRRVPNELVLIYPQVYSAMLIDRKLSSGSGSTSRVEARVSHPKRNSQDDISHTTSDPTDDRDQPVRSATSRGKRDALTIQPRTATAKPGGRTKKEKEKEDVKREIQVENDHNHSNNCPHEGAGVETMEEELVGVSLSHPDQTVEAIQREPQGVIEKPPDSLFSSRVKRRRRSSMGEEEIEVGTSRKKARTTGELSEVDEWVELCKELCLTRKQVQHLLRGIPSVLLTSTTGVPWPEEMDRTRVSIMKTYLRMPSTPSTEACHQGFSNLLMQHVAAANLFLHRLAKTLVVRIPIKCSPASAPSATATDMTSGCHGTLRGFGDSSSSLSSMQTAAAQRTSLLMSPSLIPNLFIDQPSASFSDDISAQDLDGPLEGQERQKEVGAEEMNPEPCQAPQRGDEPVNPMYDLAFCTDFGHVNMPIAPPRSPELAKEPVVPPYPCHEPFACVSYHLGFWARLLRLDPYLQKEGNVTATSSSSSDRPSQRLGESQRSEETQWSVMEGASPKGLGQPTISGGEDRPPPSADDMLWKTPYPKVKCVKSTLVFVGCGTGVSVPYYSIKLNQISSQKPSLDELTSAARKFVGSRDEKFSVAEMERRLHRLYELKDAASLLRSIFEDETAFLYQTKGTMTVKDLRYFESLWKDLLKKLK